MPVFEVGVEFNPYYFDDEIEAESVDHAKREAAIRAMDTLRYDLLSYGEDEMLEILSPSYDSVREVDDG